MESIYLIPKEKNILHHRGFLVKSTNTIEDLFSLGLKLGTGFGIMIFIAFISFIFITGLWYSTQETIQNRNIEFQILLYIIIPIISIISIFILSQSGLSVLLNGKRFLYEKTGEIYLIGKNQPLEILIDPIFGQKNNIGKQSFEQQFIIFSIFGILPFITFPKETLIFFGFNILLTLIAQLSIKTFHPIFQFGNLGEKIQKLTPQIKEQSEQIQSEFRSDMNFSVLSNGFDSLSATFSEIVSLVIKLEKVETRANKGNLFDSEKYINSLRLDIVEPLRSLREFLEIQKNKLLESQKELTRVRVGGNESTGNIELQSKRNELLAVELTENIEKLDMMIGKME